MSPTGAPSVRQAFPTSMQFVRLISPHGASSVKLQAKEETSPPNAALDSIRQPVNPINWMTKWTD